MTERWKPEDDQKYYFVNNMLTVSENNYIKNYKFDDLRYQNGNCFKTEAEAQNAAEKIKTLLLSLQDNGNNLVTDLPDKELPKLTTEVFDRPDCPKWAKYAAINGFGSLCFFDNRPVIKDDADIKYWGVRAGEDSVKRVNGNWDASDWQNSLIERPAQLPKWVEIGGYVYDDRNGYGKIVSGSVKSCYIEFDGGAGDFVPEAFAELKQARLRPYNAEEMKALVGKPITMLDGAVCLCTVYSKRDDSVILDDIHWDAQELLRSGYTIANKPCGVFEHLEEGEWVK